MVVVNERDDLADDVAQASEAAVIDVRGLVMRYGPVQVLDGVDFTAARGEVLALLGPNGAGKTSTIEILEGFRMRSAGEVSVLGWIRPEPGSTGGRVSGSCCSPGATTASGRCVSCSVTWAATTRRTRPHSVPARVTLTS